MTTYTPATQYDTNPTGTYWLDPTSSWFTDVPITSDSDKEELTLRCKSACSFVEKSCFRKFAKGGYYSVYVVGQGGDILLDNPPITSIDRICYSNGGYLTLQNPTSYSPNYSTTLTGISINQVSGGIRAFTTFNYATYPTLSQLATAINTYGNGWVASVQSGNTDMGYPCANLPSNDLVAFQMAGVNQPEVVLQWRDYNSYLAPAIWPTLEYFDSKLFEAGILSWFFPRGLRLQVYYVGGFDPVPPAIVEVSARLVLGSSRKKSLSLGDYSYTLEDLDTLPNSDRSILSRYKDRRV